MAKSFNSYLQTWCQHCLPWRIKEEKQNPTFSLSIKFHSFLSFLSFGSFWFPPLTLQADPRGPVFAGAQRCVTGGNSKRGGWALSLYFHMNRICSKKSVEMSDSHPWIHLIKQSQIWFPFFGVGFFTFLITQMWLSKILVQGLHSQKDGPLLKLLTKLLHLFTNVNLFWIFLFLIKPAL